LAGRGEFPTLDTVIGGGRHAILPLSPQRDGEAATAGIGRSMGETIEVKISGAEESLTFSGHELRKRTN